MPASDLTTAETAASVLGLEPDDTALPRLIAVASAVVADYLERGPLYQRTGIVEEVKSYRGRYLSLRSAPVAEVTSIESLIMGGTVDPSLYRLTDPEAGLVLRVGGYWPTTALLMGGIVQEDPAAGSEEPGWLVTYSAGWVTPGQAEGQELDVTLPPQIEEACLQILTNLHRGQGRDSAIASEMLGDAQVTYRAGEALAALSDASKALLDPFRWIPHA